MVDSEEFDVEVERRVRGNVRRCPTGPVRNPGRARQLGLASDLHVLHPLRPAFDDAVERKLNGLAALVGAVELRSVGEGPAVVDLDDVGGGGMDADTFTKGTVNQTGPSDNGVGFTRGSGESCVHVCVCVCVCVCARLCENVKTIIFYNRIKRIFIISLKRKGESKLDLSKLNILIVDGLLKIWKFTFG